MCTYISNLKVKKKKKERKCLGIGKEKNNNLKIALIKKNNI